MPHYLPNMLNLKNVNNLVIYAYHSHLKFIILVSEFNKHAGDIIMP